MDPGDVKMNLLDVDTVQGGHTDTGKFAKKTNIRALYINLLLNVPPTANVIRLKVSSVRLVKPGIEPLRGRRLTFCILVTSIFANNEDRDAAFHQVLHCL